MSYSHMQVGSSLAAGPLSETCCFFSCLRLAASAFFIGFQTTGRL